MPPPNLRIIKPRPVIIPVQPMPADCVSLQLLAVVKVFVAAGSVLVVGGMAHAKGVVVGVLGNPLGGEHHPGIAQMIAKVVMVAVICGTSCGRLYIPFRMMDQINLAVMGVLYAGGVVAHCAVYVSFGQFLPGGGVNVGNI